MVRSLDEIMVEQCAPTLAGIKPASLFRCRADGVRCPKEAVERWSRELGPRGIVLRVLKTCPVTGACMVYLYRPLRLQRLVNEPQTRAFLYECGYGPELDMDAMLERLSGQFCLEEEYPHEIGVFLGYPLEDVVGFIRHRGREFTLSGCWKVYGDPQAARRRFDQYHRCAQRCRARFLAGTPIAALAAG